MADCIFCKIVAHEISSFLVYEDEHTLAFLDIHPRAEGHTVVIPKKHIETLLEFPAEDMGIFFSTIQNIMAKVLKALDADGCTIGINHGSAAGQVVPHLHVHLVPRFTGDGGGSVHAVVNNPPRESLEDVLKKIKREMQE